MHYGKPDRRNQNQIIARQERPNKYQRKTFLALTTINTTHVRTTGDITLWYYTSP